MRHLEKNRFLPVLLSVINISFWICFRGSKKLFESYPFTVYINDYRVQICIFMVLGFTLLWSFYACDSVRKWILCKAAGCGILFLAYLKLYNVIKGKVVYNVSSKAGLIGIVIGEILFYLLIILVFSKKSEDQQQEWISLESISKYRNQLMGIAMLYVMLFHTTTTKAQYGDGLLYSFVKLGNAGVDIFVFLSGLGMVYSLNKDCHVLRFYKKRILRIYPDYIPIVGFYSLLCWSMGLCNIWLVITNCAGISFWISDSSYAFNWYIPAMILFYLLAPGIYHLLKDKRRRAVSFTALYFVSLIFIILCYDYLKWTGLLIAFCRIPVFLVGMLAGFWISEQKTISKSEYISLALIFLFCMFLYTGKNKMNISLYGWKWLLYSILGPVFCLYVSKLMEHINGKSRILNFLAWTGKNSLLLYLFNVLVVRFTKMFVSKHLGTNALVGDIYSLITVILNFAVVLLIIKIKEHFKWRKGLCRQQ